MADYESEVRTLLKEIDEIKTWVIDNTIHFKDGGPALILPHTLLIKLDDFKQNLKKLGSGGGTR